jgi:hypothetical protein
LLNDVLMKTEKGQLKKYILPLLLFISLCFNILYFFNILDFKINPIPSKTQELQDRTFKKFIDSPIIDSILKITPDDTLK